MTKTICKVLGVVFILIGLAGFAMPTLLGMHLSPAHNIIHLLSGALALYFGFAASPANARTFSLVFGAVYGLLGVLGFLAPQLVATVLQAHEAPGPTGSLTPDNAVHILLGVIFLFAGLARTTESRPIGTATP